MQGEMIEYMEMKTKMAASNNMEAGNKMVLQYGDQTQDATPIWRQETIWQPGTGWWLMTLDVKVHGSGAPEPQACSRTYQILLLQIKMDPSSELGSLDLGSGKMLAQPGISVHRSHIISGSTYLAARRETSDETAINQAWRVPREWGGDDGDTSRTTMAGPRKCDVIVTPTAVLVGKCSPSSCALSATKPDERHLQELIGERSSAMLLARVAAVRNARHHFTSVFLCTLRQGNAVNLLVSHQGELGSILVPDDAVGRRVFSRISRFPLPCIPEPFHTHLNPPTSALKTSVLRAAQISSPIRNKSETAAYTANSSRTRQQYGGTDRGVQEVTHFESPLPHADPLIAPSPSGREETTTLEDEQEYSSKPLVGTTWHLENILNHNQRHYKKTRSQGAPALGCSRGKIKLSVSVTCRGGDRVLSPGCGDAALFVRGPLIRTGARSTAIGQNQTSTRPRVAWRARHVSAHTWPSRAVRVPWNWNAEIAMLCPFLWGRGGVVVRLLASRVGEQGSIPGHIAPRFSHVGVVSDDAAGRRGFFFRVSPVSSALAFQRCSIITSLRPHRLSRPRWLRFRRRDLAPDWLMKNSRRCRGCFVGLSAPSQKNGFTGQRHVGTPFAEQRQVTQGSPANGVPFAVRSSQSDKKKNLSSEPRSANQGMGTPTTKEPPFRLCVFAYSVTSWTDYRNNLFWSVRFRMFPCSLRDGLEPHFAGSRCRVVVNFEWQ
ncbi:hypothetical protein PR048_001568, partial [Dryococelus australis]